MRLNINSDFLLFVSLVVVANSLGYLATDIYLPALPVMAEDLNISDGTSQLTLTAYFLSFCFTPLFFGPLSDRKGRKAVILFGLSVASIGTIFCIFASNVWILMCGRFIQGLGLGASLSGARGIIPDKYHGPQMAKIITIISMSMPLFLAFGPYVGALILVYYNWQAVFVALLVILILTIIFFILKFENTNKPSDEDFHLPTAVYHRLLTNKLFMLYGIFPIFAFIGIMAYLTAAPFLYQDLLGISEKAFGELSVIVGLTIFCGGLLNTRLLNHYNPKVLLKVTMTVMFLSSFVLLGCELMAWRSVPVLLSATMLYFLSLSFGFPNSYSISYQHINGNFGTAGSLLSSMQLGIGCLTTIVYSQIPENNFMPLALGFLFTSVGAFSVWLIIQRVEAKTAQL